MAMLSKSVQQKTAFGFGVVLIGMLLSIAFLCPTPTPFQYTVFRIILALASAGAAAMIPGFINVEVGTAVRAGGAIAVFVVVYFFSPAALPTVAESKSLVDEYKHSVPSTLTSTVVLPVQTKQTTAYIQISSESQRKDAEVLQRRLTDPGFYAPEIENVRNDSPREAEIRYFYQEDFEAAKRVKEIISQGVIFNVQLVPMLNYPNKNPPGEIEIWYPLAK